ncbi:hypothetical protein BGZ96_007335 [Linnemannia gamsii]|uniref:Uncharacterized protein n=1 Tax=Linnemannia gamsii TaxID=64522 RepID=A0ABQ7K0M7_9FUNG|nr:hypothetical protein BGZ96_007335 [Linnemannia gamsii]
MKASVALSALVAVAATLVSAAPASSPIRAVNSTDGYDPRPLPLPRHRAPPKNPPPYILVSDRDRNGTASRNGTQNGLAKAALPCRSSTLTWWSLRLDGDPADRQIHSLKLEVDSPVPMERELTDQEWTDPANGYFLRQWGWYESYYVEHRNVVNSADSVLMVTNGYGYDYWKYNERFSRRIYSDFWKRYGTSVNTLYYDCIKWRD